MAVYTRIDKYQLERLLDGLDIGRLKAYVGVADGLENTTYFVSTESAATKTTRAKQAQWVLTILELENPQQTEFSVALVQTLYGGGLPVPPLAADSAGGVIHQIAGKQALLAGKVAGIHPSTVFDVLPHGHADTHPEAHPEAHPDTTDDGHNIVTKKHCAAIGDFLGKMHRQSADLSCRLSNPYGLTWAVTSAKALSSGLPQEDQVLITQQLSRWQGLCQLGDVLPVGPIHADLFRDNALFDGDKLSAVIDFQSACTDWLLLDVAIAVNDWASTAEGEMDGVLARALLKAYEKQRPFTPAEREHWRDVQCFAALQFWLSRLLTRCHLMTPDGQVELTGRPSKDPEQYARILRGRVSGNGPLLA